MKKNFWQDVMDGVDKDIAEFSAERLSHISDGNADEDYTGDCKPTVYSFPQRSKGHKKGLFIGIGSVAAAAAVAGVVLLRLPQNVPVSTGDAQSMPVSDDQQNKSSSSDLVSADGLVNDTTDRIHEIIDSAELVSGYKKSAGFNASLFDKYFHGVWSSDMDSVTLGYSEADMFGLKEGYVCSGFILTDSACDLVAEHSGEYDVWSVSLYDPGKLVMYVNATIDGSSISGEELQLFTEKAELAEDSSLLSYFGQEKLAAEMGLTASDIFSDLTVESDGVEYSRHLDNAVWDNVFLSKKFSDEIVLAMPFSTGADGSAATYLDTVWKPDDSGRWSLDHVAVSEDMFARTAQQLHTAMTLSDLDIFEMYYSGQWTETTTGETLTLTYGADIFTPAAKCGGFYAERDGWCMYQLCGDDIQVYYISYSDPETMYLYCPGKRGYATKQGYTAEYTHTAYGAESSGTMCSMLGLERFRLNAEYNGEQELSSVLTSEIYELRDGWTAAAYTEDVQWEGFRLYRNASGSVEISYQVFDGEGNSKWVTKRLENTAAGWQTTIYLDNTKLDDSSPDFAKDSGVDGSAAVEVIDGGQSDN